jgi:hypothetical protein
LFGAEDGRASAAAVARAGGGDGVGGGGAADVVDSGSCTRFATTAIVWCGDASEAARAPRAQSSVTKAAAEMQSPSESILYILLS